jgi:superfamily II DNA/RNA helicase
MRTVQQIIRKPFISEMDLLRLQKALLICRMVADSTFLVNKKEPAYSTKLERLSDLLPQLSAEKDRKIVLFSEWTTMLTLIEKSVLLPNNIGFVRLDGSVPQKQRQVLVNKFQTDPSCVFFIATNAGATGLNLQAANTVVNVDLPWNPAILEQRIGRAHRMGQKRPVQVYLMVTEVTIEENMLKTLAAKKDLSMAALDIESDVTKVDLATGIDNLKRRLELLVADKPEAAIDESERQRVVEEAQRMARRRAVEESGGKLVSAMFAFASSLLPRTVEPAPETVAQVGEALKETLETDADGSVKMTLRLPSPDAAGNLAKVLAAFVAAAQRGS